MDTAAWPAEPGTSASVSASPISWNFETRQNMRLHQIGLYKLGKKIGRGNFATVRLAKHEVAKSKVAIKIVDKTKIAEENLVRIEREIEILRTLEHPHIVKLYEILRSERHIFIVTEYCGGGEFFEILVERGRVVEPDARRWFSQACEALAYCHDRGVVHRDIKAENMLVDKNNDLRLIDFGFSNYQLPDQMLKTSCGSPPYAAPELLLAKDYDGTKADIWSLGVFLYIMVTGGFPFPNDSIEKLKCAILSGPFKIPYFVSVECSDLLRKMLVLNPIKRYNIHQVIQHRWLVPHVSQSGEAVVNSLTPTTSSFLNAKIFEKQKLNPTVLLFLQQHLKWSEEHILEDIERQNFDGPIYATYELLCERLRNSSEFDIADQPRRGSRGSIISGRAIEPETPVPTISAHQLAQLNLLVNPDYESDDSSASEMCDDSPCSSSRRAGQRYALGEAIPFNASREQRRHTLCATEQLLPPALLAQLEALQVAVVELEKTRQLLSEAPQTVLNAYPSLLNGISPLSNMNNPTLRIPYNNERRASASEALFAAHLMTGTNIGVSAPSESPSASESINIEEEGKRYLSQQGSSKRNTVHGLGSPIPSSITNTRHLRCSSPYSKNVANERRSSWAPSPISAAQQTHLEKMYMQHVQKTGRHMSAGSDLFQIKQLQREFQRLGKLTGSTNGCSPTHSFAIDTSTMSLKNTPRISITDENNKLLGPPGSCVSTTFDPLALFEQKANDIIYTDQRPATAIGFAPNPHINSGASSPDGFRPESRGTTVICAAEPVEVVHEVKLFFDQKHMHYEEAICPEDTDSCWISTGFIRAHVRPVEDRAHVELQVLQEIADPTAEELAMRLRSMDCR